MVKCLISCQMFQSCLCKAQFVTLGLETSTHTVIDHSQTSAGSLTSF